MAFDYQESTSGSTSTSQSGTLPWYNTFIQDLLSKGQAASRVPGQIYTGQRVAGFTPDQLSAFSKLRTGLGGWQPGLNRAIDITGGAAKSLQGLQSSPYTKGALSALTNLGKTAQFDPSQQQRFMNPYISNVVNEISRLGNENITKNVGDIAGSFTEAGQFGSARNMDAATEAMIRGQREITGAQGNALFQAQQAAGEQYGDWANRGIGAQSQIAQGQMDINQFLQGLGTSTAGVGGQLGELSQQQQTQGLTDINAILGAGNQQQAQQQAQLGATQQQFQEKQQLPWQQLGNFANLISGVPTPQQSTSLSTSTSNNWSTNFKRGGLASLRKYADGGYFDDEDDITNNQLGGSGILKYLLGGNRQVSSYPDELRESIRNEPEFQPTPEGSTVGNIGEAMMRAAAQGPANWGQLIGRSGASYFDAENERNKLNMMKALKRQELLSDASKLEMQRINPLTMSKYGKIAVEMGFVPGTPEFNAKVEELMRKSGTTGEMSVPGKIARDEGLTPGTPEYNDRVNELVRFEQRVKERGLDIRGDTARTYAGNLGARRSEQEVKYGEMPSTGVESSPIPGARSPDSAGISDVSTRPVAVPVAEMVKSHEENQKDIDAIGDPVERKVVQEAYDRQRSESFSRHPGVLKFTNQGLPIKSALDKFETEGKEYDKIRQEGLKDSEPLTAFDFDRALQLNERIHKSSGPGTGIWYDIPGSISAASTLPNQYGAEIGELRAIGTRMIPSLTKGLSPVSNIDMQAMSKAGFGPEQGYATNKANIERAKSSLLLYKEKEDFFNAAREIGISPDQAKTEWNKFIKENPMFDIKETGKRGVLTYKVDPSKRGDLLKDYIETTKRKFFAGVRRKQFSPNSAPREIDSKPRIVITPDMLGE